MLAGDNDGSDVTRQTAQTPNSSEIEEMNKYAQSLGVTDAYVAGMKQAWVQGTIELAQMGGFTVVEMDAVYCQAMDFVRQKLYYDAGRVFLFLAQLDRRDVRYLRGLALAFHCLHKFGFSHGTCELALERQPDDLITLVLQGEAALYIKGKHQAHAILNHAVSLGAKNSDEQVYVERAKQILAKLRV